MGCSSSTKFSTNAGNGNENVIVSGAFKQLHSKFLEQMKGKVISWGTEPTDTVPEDVRIGFSQSNPEGWYIQAVDANGSALADAKKHPLPVNLFEEAQLFLKAQPGLDEDDVIGIQCILALVFDSKSSFVDIVDPKAALAACNDAQATQPSWVEDDNWVSELDAVKSILEKEHAELILKEYEGKQIRPILEKGETISSTRSFQYDNSDNQDGSDWKDTRIIIPNNVGNNVIEDLRSRGREYQAKQLRIKFLNKMKGNVIWETDPTNVRIEYSEMSESEPEGWYIEAVSADGNALANAERHPLQVSVYEQALEFVAELEEDTIGIQCILALIFDSTSSFKDNVEDQTDQSALAACNDAQATQPSWVEDDNWVSELDTVKSVLEKEHAELILKEYDYEGKRITAILENEEDKDSIISFQYDNSDAQDGSVWEHIIIPNSASQAVQDIVFAELQIEYLASELLLELESQCKNLNTYAGNGSSSVTSGTVTISTDRTKFICTYNRHVSSNHVLQNLSQVLETNGHSSEVQDAAWRQQTYALNEVDGWGSDFDNLLAECPVEHMPSLDFESNGMEYQCNGESIGMYHLVGSFDCRWNALLHLNLDEFYGSIQDCAASDLYL